MDRKRKACLAIILVFATKRRVKRKYWMKNWLEKRDKYSHINLLKDISYTELDDYKNYLRMSEESFNKLLRMVEPYLIREDTVMRKSLPVYDRLVLTLRYLATGRNFEDLKFSAVMSPRSISSAVFIIFKKFSLFFHKLRHKIICQKLEWSVALLYRSLA